MAGTDPDDILASPPGRCLMSRDNGQQDGSGRGKCHHIMLGQSSANQHIGERSRRFEKRR